ncbi:MAG: methyltransferase domain-containing protein [Patescibacteria group bacterium]|nr:methyltransferase domain-containing protein [Patescibacteria group bacterium]
MSHSTPSHEKLQAFFESRAAQVEDWRSRNQYYYQWLARLLRFFIPAGKKVLEVGSGLGDLLASVDPAVGVGIDFSPAMVKKAQQRHPDPKLRFVTGDVEWTVGVRETFDAIVMSDLVGYLDDIQTALENVRMLCHERTRLLVTQYNRLWEPFLHVGAWFSLNQPKPLNNWLSAKQLVELLDLAGFEVVTRGWTFLFPKRWGGMGDFINRTLGRLPLVRRLCLVQYFVARPRVSTTVRRYPMSLILPVREGAFGNDAGRVSDFIARVPSLGSRTEMVFVVADDDARSRRAVEEAIAMNAGRRQVRLVAGPAGWEQMLAGGAQHATGELLVCLSPDLSVAPEELPKFYQVIADGKADCVVGSRLVYPSASVKIFGRLSTRCFSSVLSWIIGQRVTDARSRVVVLRRDDARKIFFPPHKKTSGMAGVLVGAARLGLKIAEIPVHYQLPADGISDHSAPVRTLISCLREYSL